MSSPAARPAGLPLAARLHTELTAALRAQDKIAASVIRSALAAIANAEAVAVSAGPGLPAVSSHVAGARLRHEAVVLAEVLGSLR